MSKSFKIRLRRTRSLARARGLILAFFAGLFAVTPLGVAQTLYPLQPHPDALAWPTEAWPRGAMEDETALTIATLIEAVIDREKTDLMGETRAVVIIHKGQLVAEAYRDGFTAETRLVSWSMAKSFTQAFVGRAVQLGLVADLDAAMPTRFAEADSRSQISWRHWLTMSDGLNYKEINATGLYDNDVVNMMYGRGKFDVLAYIDAELPSMHSPGEVWNYSTAAFHLISAALQEVIASGSAAETADFLAGEFFDHIGMTAQPEFDAAGTFLGGSLIYASAQDFAKFGYLYLRDGMWEDDRLLPAGWVDFARTKTPASNANVYGAGWWIIPPEGEALSHDQSARTPPYDAFHAGGHEGQTIWVVPSRDLVIVRLGLMPNSAANWGALYEWNQQIARAFTPIEFSE